MTKNKVEERSGSNNDEEYGEFEGAEMEDEAPEAVQAHTGHSPWVPDLLRVQSNNASNCSSAEDDAPESLSFTQRLRSNIHFANADSTSSGVRRETGAIPKARPLAPPDVSQIGCGSMGAMAAGVSPKVTSSTVREYDDLFKNSLPLASSRSSSNVPKSSGVSNAYSMSDRDVKALRVEKNAILKPEVLQRDNQTEGLQSNVPIFGLPGAASSLMQQQQSSANLGSSEISQKLDALADQLNRLQMSVDSSSRQVMERLSVLETRVNNIFARNAENGSSSLCNANENSRHSCEQQRQLFENERRQFFISFADILRKAAENNVNSEEDRRDLNGPQQ